MKTTKLFLLPVLLLFSCASLHAQVTIGGIENPKAGAILDLNSSTKGGLILSNVTIADPELIPQNTNVFEGVGNANLDVNEELRGIMVYNDGQYPAVPAGIYIWNGYCWTKDGSVVVVSAPSITINNTVTDSYAIVENGSVTFAVVSPQPDVNYAWYKNDSPSILVGTGNTYTTPALFAGTYGYYCTAISDACPSSNTTSISLTVTVDVPYSLPVGSGTLAGRACFDVAQINDGDRYGRLSVRQLASLPAPVLRADFTQAETNTQIYTFIPSGGGISKLRFHAVEATAYNGQIISSLYYDRNLETQNSITLPKELTVVYKNLNGTATGKDVSEALKVDIYAVYNDKPDGSGDDQTVKLTASIRDCACCGAFVNKGQWLNFMCHNQGANNTLNPLVPAQYIHGAKYKWGTASPALSQIDDQNNPNAISGWSTITPQPTTSGVNWDMSTSVNPCPSGWRIPTRDEWEGVISNNSWTRTATPWSFAIDNYMNGCQVGSALFLPASGTRDQNGKLCYRGDHGHYWASTANDTLGEYMYFNIGTLRTHEFYRDHAFAVRCVAE
jgi:uncharacterized protein (TIGR02145 family)